MLRKVKQLLSNFEAERWENLSNLRLTKKSVAYKKNPIRFDMFIELLKYTYLLLIVRYISRKIKIFHGYKRKTDVANFLISQ